MDAFFSWRKSRHREAFSPPSELSLRTAESVRSVRYESTVWNQSFADFYMERPSDDVIQSMFSSIGIRLKVGEEGLTMEGKWLIVYENERRRWCEDQDKDFEQRATESGGTSSIGTNSKNSGDYYIQKFLTGAITLEDIQDLGVSLLIMPWAWLHDFIDMGGIAVLASRLNTLNRPTSWRTEVETQQEVEILKCLTTLLNSQVGQREALAKQTTVNHLITVLGSPHIPSRKTGLELTIGLLYFDDYSLQLVLNALDFLSDNHNEDGCFKFWFHSTLTILLSRGRMGSLVGTSKDFKKAVGADSSLGNYTLHTIMAINAILKKAPDLKTRISLRSNMEIAGVQQIIEISKEMGDATAGISISLKHYFASAEDDQADLRDHLGWKVLKDMQDPHQLVNAIIETTKESPAQGYFMSCLKHLLLIPQEDTPTRTKYYQIIDGLITDIILERRVSYAREFGDPTTNSFRKLATSFIEQERAHLIEQERARKAEAEASELRGELERLKYQKELVDKKPGEGNNGLVKDLGAKPTALQELGTSSQAAPPPPPPPPPPPSSSHSKQGSITKAPELPRPDNDTPKRKGVDYMANTRMKQLQWDKIQHQEVGKTLWNEKSTDKELEWARKLFGDGVWQEIEEGFKAKQLVMNLMARQKRAELKSVLDQQTKKRLEIIIQRVKRLTPEEIASKILQSDREVCTESFLDELKRVLPSPEQVGKLNVYRSATMEELSELHPSDRLMVQLIKVDRLSLRVGGMIYRARFEEDFGLQEDGATRLIEACKSLKNAPAFKELMGLILLIGNFMNGTGIKGGAFGFKVSSINKLVDTKSVNNTTLLHFLERTVSKHFPEMEKFLDELQKPEEAYRVNLQEVRKHFGGLRVGLKSIRTELQEHFSDIDSLPPDDQYPKKMWRFLTEGTEQLEGLSDAVKQAELNFGETLRYYGEDEKMSSAEFFGIFKTFCTSYRKCQNDNRAAAEEKIIAEKRRQYAEESRLARQKARDEQVVCDPQDAAILDTLLERLRNGDTIPRRSSRTRPIIHRLPGPPIMMGTTAASDNGSNKVDVHTGVMEPDISTTPADAVADKARQMLAELQQAGFGVPPRPMSMGTLSRGPRAGGGSTRRARARAEARARISDLQVHPEEGPMDIT